MAGNKKGDKEITMTYEEMKDKIYKLQLEDLRHGIKVEELNNPPRFEAAGLGIIDLSQIEYYGPIGLFEIYSGLWGDTNKKTIKRIVPTTQTDVYGEYFSMIKDVEKIFITGIDNQHKDLKKKEQYL